MASAHEQLLAELEGIYGSRAKAEAWLKARGPCDPVAELRSIQGWRKGRLC
jgi:hypothetical protein